jgi:hypothetical protein
MDIADILITLVIFVILIGSEVLKMKKKQAAASQKISTEEDEEEEYFDSLEENSYEEIPVMKNEKNKSNSSKSTTYFTYEEDSGVESLSPSSEATKPSNNGEINIQEVENETETKDIDLQDPEELKKAIIYSEILKNPYN